MNESDFLNLELAGHKPGRPERTITCMKCNGSGLEPLSDCCNAPVIEPLIINGVSEAVCTHCGLECYYGVDCDGCGGTGKITL